MEEAPSGGKVPLVELKNIGKSYGNITALKDISLRVHAGEVTGILGRQRCRQVHADQDHLGSASADRW